MINRIHILGASGSGTSTLAKELYKSIDYEWFDTDNFFWQPTDPPFQKKRDIKERKELLGDRLKNTDRWILSGSLCGWGDEFIPLFDLVIYLWIPQDIRLDRIIKREKQRYGKEIEAGGSMYESHLEFVDWASQYDNGDLNIRSKALHEKWISELNCQLLRLEGDFKLEEKVQKVLEILRTTARVK